MKRALAYAWTFPTTLLGLAFVPLALVRGSELRIVAGVLEISGPAIGFLLRRCVPIKGGASAMTLGHVVVARDRLTHDLTRAHERIHVRQAERWGPLFIPAYLIASVIQLLRGRRPYFDNPFEIQAFREANR